MCHLQESRVQKRKEQELQRQEIQISKERSKRAKQSFITHLKEFKQHVESPCFVITLPHPPPQMVAVAVEEQKSAKQKISN